MRHNLLATFIMLATIAMMAAFPYRESPWEKPPEWKVVNVTDTDEAHEIRLPQAPAGSEMAIEPVQDGPSTAVKDRWGNLVCYSPGERPYRKIYLVSTGNGWKVAGGSELR